MRTGDTYRGLPVESGVLINELRGVSKVAVMVVEYRPLDALDEPQDDYDPWDRSYRPGINIQFANRNSAWTHNLNLKVARQLLKELKEVLKEE